MLAEVKWLMVTKEGGGVRKSRLPERIMPRATIALSLLQQVS